MEERREDGSALRRGLHGAPERGLRRRPELQEAGGTRAAGLQGAACGGGCRRELEGSATARPGTSRKWWEVFGAFFPRLLLAASGGYQGPKLANLFSLASRFWAAALRWQRRSSTGDSDAPRGSRRKRPTTAPRPATRQTVLSAFEEVEDNLAALLVLSEEATQQADAVAAAERSLALP